MSFTPRLGTYLAEPHPHTHHAVRNASLPSRAATVMYLGLLLQQTVVRSGPKKPQVSLQRLHECGSRAGLCHLRFFTRKGL